MDGAVHKVTNALKKKKKITILYVYIFKQVSAYLDY